MLSGLFNRNDVIDRRAALRLVERCELSCSAGDAVTIQPRLASLSCGELLEIIEALDQETLHASSYVCFDFSRVSELVGAWSVHLAILIDFARKMRVRTILTGLRGQPAAVAAFYRHSPEVQSICLTRRTDGLMEVSGLSLREVA